MTAGAPETAGYCLACGEYGRGVYAHMINDRAEAIREHVGCAKPRLAGGRASGTARRGRAGIAATFGHMFDTIPSRRSGGTDHRSPM